MVIAETGINMNLLKGNSGGNTLSLFVWRKEYNIMSSLQQYMIATSFTINLN